MTLNLSGKIVLVVDDNRGDNELIRDAMVNLKFDARLASSLDEADAFRSEVNPHGIILDVGIPQTYGQINKVPFSDILDAIKRYKDKQCVVIITGTVNWEHVRQAMAAGACDYLDKNIIFNRMMFESRIRQAFELHEARLMQNPLANLMEACTAIRSSMETLYAVFSAEIKDAKERGTSTVSYEKGVADTNARWRKLLFGGATALGYAVAFGLWKGLRALVPWLKRD